MYVQGWRVSLIVAPTYIHIQVCDELELYFDHNCILSNRLLVESKTD
jgi:hypothetical protein